MTNATTTREPSRALTIGEELGSRMPQFRAALPAHIPQERFARVVLTAIQQTPKLIQMDRASLWNACMKAAQDGLLPDGRDGALVPFKGKVQWMVMIGGLRKKVRNSDDIATWDVYAVHAKDDFSYELGDEPFIRHKPFLDSDPGPLIAAYSVAVLKSGEKTREIMSRAEIEYVRDSYAQRDANGEFSPAWRKSFDEMAKKTVARRHSKVLPMSTDLDDLIRRDDELYDMKGASDKTVAPRGPKGLDARLDALIGVDPETGEISDGAAPVATSETATGRSGSPVDEAKGAGSSVVHGEVESASPVRSADDLAPKAAPVKSLHDDLVDTGTKIAREGGREAFERWLEEDLSGSEVAVLTFADVVAMRRSAQ